MNCWKPGGVISSQANHDLDWKVQRLLGESSVARNTRFSVRHLSPYGYGEDIVQREHNFPLDLAAAEATPVALKAPTIG